MMEYEDQLRIQAYLDGELSPAEAREVSARLAKDPETAALARELQQTRTALAGFEEGISVPESRDFYWSKIQREIQRQEAPARAAAAPSPALAWLFGLMRPAVAVALVVLVGSLVLKEAWPGAPTHAAVTALEDPGAFTYHDSAAGVTLVWLSYPAEKTLPGEEEVAIVE